jgi:hypothetical protein
LEEVAIGRKALQHSPGRPVVDLQSLRDLWCR